MCGSLNRLSPIGSAPLAARCSPPSTIAHPINCVPDHAGLLAWSDTLHAVPMRQYVAPRRCPSRPLGGHLRLWSLQQRCETAGWCDFFFSYSAACKPVASRSHFQIRRRHGHTSMWASRHYHEAAHHTPTTHLDTCLHAPHQPNSSPHSLTPTPRPYTASTPPPFPSPPFTAGPTASKTPPHGSSWSPISAPRRPATS